MKKIFIPFLALSLAFANVSPILVNAEETEKVSDVARQFGEEVGKVETEVIKNEKTGIDTIHLNYEGKDSIATMNHNNGELIVDGELFAIVTREESALDTEIYTDLKQPDMSTLSNVKYYTVGSPDYGSGFYKQTYSDFGTLGIVATAATVVGIAAAIAALCVKLMDIQGFAKTVAVVSVASMFFQMWVSDNLSITWTYKHYRDLDRNNWFMDVLGLYHGGKVDSSRFKAQITHYYGNLF